MNGEVRLGMVLAAAAIAMFATNLDFFALNLSIPGMARELHSSTTNMQWVISGFMLALGSFLIPGGAPRRHPRPQASVDRRHRDLRPGLARTAGWRRLRAS